MYCQVNIYKQSCQDKWKDFIFVHVTHVRVTFSSFFKCGYVPFTLWQQVTFVILRNKELLIV